MDTRRHFPQVHVPRWFLTASLLALAGPMTGLEAGDHEVKITKLDGRLRVERDGKLFTEYVYEGHGKPILYPVVGPHGIAMTRNYPMKKDAPGEAHDHPHHRSLWFTHGDVNGISFWHEGSDAGKIVQKEILDIVSGDSEGLIRTRNRWIGPDGETVCTNERTIRFFEIHGDPAIDFEVRIHASNGDVTFGDTKEGTMGIRTHPALRLAGGDGKALNSEGHRDRELWGKRARWVDYWGPIDGKTVGVAIFDHPKNPAHPTWWHARHYGLVAANPFGVHDFEKKPPRTGDMKIEAGESVTFRYRFYFHRGDGKKEAKIEEVWKDFASRGTTRTS